MIINQITKYKNQILTKISRNQKQICYLIKSKLWYRRGRCPLEIKSRKWQISASWRRTTWSNRFRVPESASTIWRTPTARCHLFLDPKVIRGLRYQTMIATIAMMMKAIIFHILLSNKMHSGMRSLWIRSMRTPSHRSMLAGLSSWSTLLWRRQRSSKVLWHHKIIRSSGCGHLRPSPTMQIKIKTLSLAMIMQVTRRVTAPFT